MSRPTKKEMPPAESTSDRILDAAMACFLEHGFAQTSLDQVASEAGVTKPTVYSHFESKANLFRCVVQRHAGQRLVMIDHLGTPSEDTRADLTMFGETFLAVVLSSQSRLWDRLAASESMAHPEVGQMFFDAGPAKVLGVLSTYLKHQKAAGRLSMDSPQRAAEQLIGLLIGVDFIRSLSGQPPMSKAQRKRRCREAVDVFLAAYEVQNHA